MLRFVTFVDGSNLDGVLKHLNLRVDDYGAFYRHVFEQSVQYWGRTFADGSPWPTAQHSRIYWYVVGKMDEWDLNDPKAESRLRSRFDHGRGGAQADHVGGGITRTLESRLPPQNAAQAQHQECGDHAEQQNVNRKTAAAHVPTPTLFASR